MSMTLNSAHRSIVAGRSAGESNDTLDPGPYLHQSLEAF